MMNDIEAALLQMADNPGPMGVFEADDHMRFTIGDRYYDMDVAEAVALLEILQEWLERE